MGMSSSQARLLTLTSRLHDIESKAQRYQSRKLQLSKDSSHAYEKYLRALDSTKLQYKTLMRDGTVTFRDANLSILENGAVPNFEGETSNKTFLLECNDTIYLTEEFAGRFGITENDGVRTPEALVAKYYEELGQTPPAEFSLDEFLKIQRCQRVKESEINYNDVQTSKPIENVFLPDTEQIRVYVFKGKDIEIPDVELVQGESTLKGNISAITTHEADETKALSKKGTIVSTTKIPAVVKHAATDEIKGITGATCLDNSYKDTTTGETTLRLDNIAKNIYLAYAIANNVQEDEYNNQTGFINISTIKSNLITRIGNEENDGNKNDYYGKHETAADQLSGMIKNDITVPQRNSIKDYYENTIKALLATNAGTEPSDGLKNTHSAENLSCNDTYIYENKPTPTFGTVSNGLGPSIECMSRDDMLDMIAVDIWNYQKSKEKEWNKQPNEINDIKNSLLEKFANNTLAGFQDCKLSPELNELYNNAIKSLAEGDFKNKTSVDAIINNDSYLKKIKDDYSIYSAMMSTKDAFYIISQPPIKEVTSGPSVSDIIKQMAYDIYSDDKGIDAKDMENEINAIFTKCFGDDTNPDGSINLEKIKNIVSLYYLNQDPPKEPKDVNYNYETLLNTLKGHYKKIVGTEEEAAFNSSLTSLDSNMFNNYLANSYLNDIPAKNFKLNSDSLSLTTNSDGYNVNASSLDDIKRQIAYAIYEKSGKTIDAQESIRLLGEAFTNEQLIAISSRFGTKEWDEIIDGFVTNNIYKGSINETYYNSFYKQYNLKYYDGKDSSGKDIYTTKKAEYDKKVDDVYLSVPNTQIINNTSYKKSENELPFTFSDDADNKVRIPKLATLASNMLVAFRKLGKANVAGVTESNILARLEELYSSNNQSNNEIIAWMNDYICNYLNSGANQEEVKLIYKKIIEGDVGVLNLKHTLFADRGVYKSYVRDLTGKCEATYGTKEKETYRWVEDENYKNAMAIYNGINALLGRKVHIVDNEKANDYTFVRDLLEENKGILLEFTEEEGLKETNVPIETTLIETHDEEGQILAEAEYEDTLVEINKKEAKFDAILASVERDHTATKKQIESLKKVSADNTEISFKLFS